MLCSSTPHSPCARTLNCIADGLVPHKSRLTPDLAPRRLSDLVGADIGMHVGQNMAGSYGDRVYPSRIIQLLFDAKRLGEKTGAGFYKFDKRKAKPDPELAQYIERSRKARPCSLRRPLGFGTRV